MVLAQFSAGHSGREPETDSESSPSPVVEDPLASDASFSADFKNPMLVLKGLSSKIGLAESGIIRQNFLKGRGAEISK